MRIYYIHNGTVQEGPFTLDQLKQKNLTPHTAIWYEGLPSWSTAEKLPELAGFFKQTPPPFEGFHNPFPEQVWDQPPKKNPLIVPLTIIGIVICVGLLGLFVYNNTANAEELSEVKQVQTEITEKQNKEASERLAEEARRKAINEAITKKNREYRNNRSTFIQFGEVYADIDKFWGGVKAFDIPIGC